MWNSKKCSNYNNDNTSDINSNNAKYTIMGAWIMLILITIMIGRYLLRDE